MASIELYINRQLCDIDNPSNFTVYLKRQLLNPSELSTKDSQRSYDLTLPASPTNNAIFGHTNAEEVKGKFARLYDATLYVDGVNIFDGKFRMSEITKTNYKGNLGIPAQKTVKDIFGDLMMNQTGEWLIRFGSMSSMHVYNNYWTFYKTISPCIFPLVLYGISFIDRNHPNPRMAYLNNWYSLTKNNFPPSINCIEALRVIFENKGLSLSGTAFSDVRMTNLYMSYKNPKEYVMNWKHKETYWLNLISFLPSDVKVNDWIDNFCKAFNLNLIQTDSDKFELNINQQKDLNISSIINLDKKTNVDYQRKNNSLGLPSVYEMGFKVDKNEQGYIETMDDGGGVFETDSPEPKTINQSSNFSHNWFKRLEVIRGLSNVTEVDVPVITDKEVWSSKNDYEEMKSKSYTNNAQRFWYKKKETFYLKIENITATVALVTDTFEDERGMRLDYKNAKQGRDTTDSILTSYFTMLSDADNCYTTVECFLTADEYNNIANSLIELNGDLYYTAEVDGYDPLCRKKATLKLIKKQL